MKITMDGAALVDQLQGTALSPDPGAHTFRFEAPGHSALEKALVIVEGVKERHERVTLAMAATAPPPGTVPVPPDGATSQPSTPAPSPEGATAGEGSTWKTVGLVAGSAGLVGIGLGTVFGLIAQGLCPNKVCATQDDENRAYNDATISTTAFVVGGVLLGGGALVYLLAPQGATEAGVRVGVAPFAGSTTGGLKLAGAW